MSLSTGLAEAVRDDLEPSPLLDEEALQEIRGAGRAAMRHRKPQVGDAGLEVVFEAGDRARQQRAVIGPNALGEVTSDGSRWGLVTGARTRLELRPQVSRTLTARLRIRCARLRCRAERGKHSSIARMIPGAPSETTSSGSPRPRPRMSWKKARTVSVSSFDPAIRCSRTLRQAARTGSRAWPARSRSAMPSTKR